MINYIEFWKSFYRKLEIESGVIQVTVFQILLK